MKIEIDVDTEGLNAKDLYDVELEDAQPSVRGLLNQVRMISERELAKKLHAQLKSAEQPPMDLATLGEVLARPEPPGDRVQDLAPWGGSTLCTAQAKTGKTITFCNLSKSLLSGDMFLNRFDVRPIADDAMLAYLNYEVSDYLLAKWLDDLGVDHDRLILINLRGRRNPLADESSRHDLAQQLAERNTETLLVDTFSRAFTGESQNDAGQVQAFLGMLDTFARQEVGATDLFLTNHAGWSADDRSRGSSALEDWPDAMWKLTRDGERRFFSARSRLDADVPEDELSFDPTTRRLSMTGNGSRDKAKESRHLKGLLSEALDILTESPGMKTGDIEAALKDAGMAFQKGDVSKALSLGVDEGQLTRVKGQGNAKLYSPVI